MFGHRPVVDEFQFNPYPAVRLILDRHYIMRIFVLSIFEWLFYTGLTVFIDVIVLLYETCAKLQITF